MRKPGDMDFKRATIKDVAALAKVSPTVVSRLLSKDSTLSVADSTRERVYTAVEQLSYVPNYMARGLRKHKTDMVGFMIIDCANPFYGEMIRGVQAPLNQRGMFCFLSETLESDKKAFQLVQLYYERQVDGLICATAKEANDPAIAYMERMGMKYVLVTRSAKESTAPTVMYDIYDGAKCIVEHLIELGHVKIAHLTGQLQSSSSILRLNAYRDVMLRHGLTIREEYIVNTDWLAEDGYTAMRKLLSLKEIPTAVFACNDIVAISAINAVTELGLKVPEDISIVGFNNIKVCANTWPPLTTLESPAYELGKEAAALLIQLIDGDKTGEKNVTLPHGGLIIRRSTAPLNQ